MRIAIKLNARKLTVIRTGSRDIDSTNLEIHYNGAEIGYGHLNNRTNTAHITITNGLMNEVDECNLIDYLVDGVENRTLSIQ